MMEIDIEVDTEDVKQKKLNEIVVKLRKRTANHKQITPVLDVINEDSNEDLETIVNNNKRSLSNHSISSIQSNDPYIIKDDEIEFFNEAYEEGLEHFQFYNEDIEKMRIETLKL